MKRNNLFILAVLIGLLLIPSWSYAEQQFHLQSQDQIIEVLTAEEFEAQFGDNPDVPRTDDQLIALAKEMYPKASDEAAGAAHGAECHEYELGMLYAGLGNPAISDRARIIVDQIIPQIPTFNKIRTIGHFKFYYCTSGATCTANDMVTDAEIDSLASSMNAYWNSYAASFKEPKHYLSGLTKLVDVKVYYLGTSLLGETSSSWNHINLNSKYCVKDAACKRKTTSAHELFHRVQYAYGYVTGTANMKWIVEGSASWSQKFTNISLRDYMGRMNSGLAFPDKALINGASARSYDACHFWVWLEKRANTFAAIRDVWYQYSINGKNAKTAVNTVVVARSLASSFDIFTRDWNKANYVKDFSVSGLYDYYEDPLNVTTSCGTFSLSHAPRSYYAILSNSTIIGPIARTVYEYGADFYEFTINAAVTRFKIALDRTSGSVDWALMGSKAGAWKIIYNSATDPKTWDLTFAAGTYDKIGLIVAGKGMASSGYTFRVGP